MVQGFEWDDAKAIENSRKHHVSFDEAASVFDDPLLITIEDSDHSGEELRFLTIGWSTAGRLLVVCHLPPLQSNSIDQRQEGHSRRAALL